MSMFEPYVTNRIHSKQKIKPTIKRASSSDKKALATLFTERHQEPLVKMERLITQLLELPHSAWFMVYQSEQPLAYAALRYFSPQPEMPKSTVSEGWYLMGLYVTPEFRSQGLGAALTQHRINWLYMQTDTIYYFVNSQNRVSIALHEKFGFTFMRKPVTYPGVTFSEGGHGLLFVKNLVAPV